MRKLIVRKRTRPNTLFSEGKRLENKLKSEFFSDYHFDNIENQRVRPIQMEHDFHLNLSLRASNSKTEDQMKQKVTKYDLDYFMNSGVLEKEI